MKNVFITRDSIIRVYFDDVQAPTRMEYVVEVNGKLIGLHEQGADMNDLVDIQEMAQGGLQECRDENFYLNYYEVENAKFNTEFTDKDIPVRYFDLGTLTFSEAFQKLVEAANSPNSDLEKAIIGLLLFAEENATEEDKKQFIEWLDEKTMLSAMHGVNTSPVDWFECAEGKTWKDMEQVYEESHG